MNILERLESLPSHSWLLDLQGNPLTPNFRETFHHHYQHIQQTPTDGPLIIAESNPVQFLAQFLAVCAAHRTVLLGNTHWVQSEWEQVKAICAGQRQKAEGLGYQGIRGCSIQNPKFKIQNPKSKIPPRAILIPTGGTAGTLRFAIHTWDTLTASVRGFQQHFHVSAVNTCCVLPLYHVSGLMQFMRSFLSDGQMIVATFKEFEQSDALAFDSSACFLSLVPTQLARLYQRSNLLSALQAFQAILLGGAPPWPALLTTARQHYLPLAPTYGMTETASQVATLRPSEFLKSSSTGIANDSGPAHYGSNVGSALPHAQISIRSVSGQPLPPNQTGQITIQAQSLALGYCSPNGIEWMGDPQKIDMSDDTERNASPRRVQSNDLGFLDASGYLHVVGRQRDMIISGGENIVPTEVEAAIRSTGLVKDVAVIGVSDRLWGEAVTAIYVPCEGLGPESQEGEGRQETTQWGEKSIKAALREMLNRIKHPKYWIAVAALPRNAQGKINRVELGAIASKHNVNSYTPHG